MRAENISSHGVHGMTFAELFLGALFLFLLYKLLGPLQRRIERTLLGVFDRERAGGRTDRRDADIINITNYKVDDEERKK